MSDVLKILRDGTRRTGRSVDETARAYHEDRLRSGDTSSTYDDSRRRVVDHLNRSDRKRGE